MMKKIVGDELVWTSTNVKETTIELFASISGGDGSMDIEEFERWLGQMWLQMKAQYKPPKEPPPSPPRSSLPSSPTTTLAALSEPPSTSASPMPDRVGGVSYDDAAVYTPSPVKRTPVKYQSIGKSLTTDAPEQSEGVIMSDRHRDIAEARRLKAMAQQAVQEAMAAQARAKRLTEVAAYAEEAAAAAEHKVRTFYKTEGRLMRAHNSRHKLIQGRERREAGQPNQFFTAHLNQSTSSLQLLNSSSRPSTAGSPGRLPTPDGRPRRPPTASPKFGPPVSGGPFVGLPTGSTKNAYVPYWA